MGAPARILVVEDDADIREAMSECLVLDGFSPDGAPNGAVALAALRTAPFDAVVLDLMMPVMSGRELLAVMSADPSLSRIPVVVCTALRDADLTGLGAACLFKPFDVPELLSTLRRVMGSGDGAPRA